MGNQTSGRKIYFKEPPNRNENGFKKNKMKEKVIIKISISNSDSLSEYYIKSYEINDEKVHFLIETEKLKGNNDIIQFHSTFILDYYFECEQNLTFKIYINNIENIINISLGTILGSNGNCYHQKINEIRNEIINISAFQNSEISYSNGTHLQITFYIINDNNIKGFKFTDINNKFYFKITNKTDLYRSEDLSDKGTFHSIKIPLSFLSPNITITFYNLKNEKITSLNEITITELIHMNESSFPIIINKKKINILIKSNYKNKTTFLDYIEKNLEIGLGISIDFTGSSHYLHFPENNTKSKYEELILSCGKILAPYDSDQKFPVFGFGAENIGKYNKNCFPINFNDNPEIYTIKGVINEYHNCLKKIKLSSPTFYSNSIEYFVNEIKKQNNILKYNILLILTDGDNDDMNETKNIIFEAAKLPISIIIVGLGNCKFNNMKILDGDEEPLCNCNGEKVVRDIVKFVSFNQFMNNPVGLAKEVLEEIPTQVVEFFNYIGIEPEDL